MDRNQMGIGQRIGLEDRSERSMDGNRSLSKVFFGATAAVILFGLSACSEGPTFEKRHTLAKQSGTYNDVCRTAQDTAQAYLRDGNQEKYAAWTIDAFNDCSNAKDKCDLLRFGKP